MNVLFINADQLRWDALSCMGRSPAKTPHLDRLAREGVRFTRAYTPSPVCVPARTSWQLGMYPHSTGCTGLPRDEDINFGSGSFDQNLARLGYTAEYHGRYHAPPGMLDCYSNEISLNFLAPYRAYLREHLGQPPAPAPGQFPSYLSGWPYTPDPPDYELRKSQDDIPGNECPGVEYGTYDLPAEHSYTAHCATQTLDALDRLQGEPFIITTGILHPHHPQYVPRPYAGSIDPGSVPPPEHMHDRREGSPFADNPWQIDAVEMANMPMIQARYYELVRELDDHVGRILDKLDETGLADDTLVIFCSDHGEMLGDHGLTQKFVPYEASARVPLLMRLPGRIPKGHVVNHPVNLIDLYPTIFDYAGLPCPEQEGVSLRPLVEGRGADRSELVFVEIYRWYTMVVSTDRKLAWMHNPNAVDWFIDLEADPGETTNLLRPVLGGVQNGAAELKAELLGWMETFDHPHREQFARQALD